MTTEDETAAQRAHRVIRDQIVDGTHPGGSMLSENALAAALGTSRTPVRAALLRLAEEDWVTIYPKRGALVRTFTAEDGQELAGARHLLETGGVRAASAEALARTCTRLDALVDAQEAAVREADRDGFVELCTAFHRAFVEVGGNRLLLDVADRLRNRQAAMLHRSLATIDAHAREIVDDHRALVDSARHGDLDRFAGLLHAHLTHEPAPRYGLA
ncbi:GntR family transcriptional regulator [Modestobacter sp. NPDC049651]|uniref:GntR family transcriptional regulator n=1 Tax=unclassified Modestobacter TaxID=2643866 RepID=UPI0033D39107